MSLVPDDASYEWVRWRLRSKIDADLAAGSPRNPFSDVDERIFAEHDTPAHRAAHRAQPAPSPGRARRSSAS
jgi:hypothetical protein